MQIKLRMDNVALIRRLEKGERRLAFAAINAINGAAKDIQEAQKEALIGRVTVRRPDFTLRQIAVIRPFASVGKARPFAEVQIGNKPRTLLAKLEVGGMKEHRGKFVAIPITGEEARPTFATAQEFPPLVRRLKFKKGRGLKGGAGKVRQGEGGRYLIPGVGIFKRTGTETREIVAFKREVRVRPILGWLVRARAVGTRALRERMQREAIEAIGRAGGRLG